MFFYRNEGKNRRFFMKQGENMSTKYKDIIAEEKATLMDLNLTGNISNPSTSTQYKAYIVVCVISAPKNAKERDVIRKTWAHIKRNDTKVLFVVGTGQVENVTRKAIMKEYSANRDLILLQNVKESFETLTLKVIETMKWIHYNFIYNYFMKVDDDTFLRLDLVLKALSAKPRFRLYWGYFVKGSPILKRGKWAEPRRYICEKYVAYAGGGGYILSNDLVQFIVQNSAKLIKFKNEDVSIGTWMISLDIHRMHDGRFKQYRRFEMCNNSTENVLLLHPVPWKDMETLYKSKHIKC